MLSDRSIWNSAQRLLLLILFLSSLAACQIRPLYDGQISQKLSSVSISEPTTAVEQSVRNELVFLMYGGKAEPINADYKLKLSVSYSVADVVYDKSLGSNIAARVTMVGNYSLTRVNDNKAIGSGTKDVTALIDDLDQAFARKRAVRDAQNRAGRELAELIRADVAISLSSNEQ